MALRVQVPDCPRPGGDVTRPVHQSPSESSSTAAPRQANDYVATPSHADADSQRMLTERVHYHVQTSESVLLTPEPDLRTTHPPNLVVAADPRLPSKQNAGAAAAPRCTGDPSSACPRCGRCRCDGCRRTTPRDLPRRWCGGWECSAASTVDWLSCMCCVRATFYHCCPDSEEEPDYADNPCGCCDHPKCPSRWVFIVVVALFLPCLVLYWPLRGALALLTDCYNVCGPGGCRCDQRLSAFRPLIEAENCSA